MTKTLEQRLDELESIEQIKKLKYQYCRYCDMDYDQDAIASLFLEDGVWQSGANDVNTGQDAIKRKFEGMSTKVPFAAHMVVNPMIEVTGNAATGRWWLIMPCTRIVDDKLAGYWLLGEYEEEYARIAGVWKIKKLCFTRKYWTPHLQDWAPEIIRK